MSSKLPGVTITAEEQAAFQRWLDRPVDWHFDGSPITCRSTMHESIQAEVEFGWHARASQIAAPPVDAVPGEPVTSLVQEAKHWLSDILDATYSKPAEQYERRDKCVAAIDKLAAIATPMASRAVVAEPVEMGSVLQRVMARLADLLDEDQFNNIAAMVEGAGFTPPEPEPMQSEWPIDRAVEMLTAYAELVKATGRYAEEHYIPEVEQVISELRTAPIAPAATAEPSERDFPLMRFPELYPVAAAEPSESLIDEMRAQIKHLVDDLVEVLDDDGLPRYRPLSGMMFSNFVSALIRWSDRAGVASLVAGEGLDREALFEIAQFFNLDFNDLNEVVDNWEKSRVADRASAGEAQSPTEPAVDAFWRGTLSDRNKPA